MQAARMKPFDQSETGRMPAALTPLLCLVSALTACRHNAELAALQVGTEGSQQQAT